MVANRTSILNAARALADLVIEGGTITHQHKQLAAKVLAITDKSGAYIRQYETHEERVLMRHLNLYKNKLEAANTKLDKEHWVAKVAEQEVKVALFHSALDLDGL